MQRISVVPIGTASSRLRGGKDGRALDGVDAEAFEHVRQRLQHRQVVKSKGTAGMTTIVLDVDQPDPTEGRADRRRP